MLFECFWIDLLAALGTRIVVASQKISVNLACYKISFAVVAFKFLKKYRLDCPKPLVCL